MEKRTRQNRARQAAASLLLLVTTPLAASAADNTAGATRVSQTAPRTAAVHSAGHCYESGGASCMDDSCGPLRGRWGAWRGAYRMRYQSAFARGRAVRPTVGRLPSTPIQRTANVYQNYWAPSWVGQGGPIIGGVYPMVYQPTDTTQLGFYYTHVPYWHVRPEMLPQPPVSGWMGTGIYGGGYGYAGGSAAYPGGYVAGGAAGGTVVTAPAVVAPVTPVPQPVPAVVAPPAADQPPPIPIEPEPEAYLGGVRRAN